MANGKKSHTNGHYKAVRKDTSAKEIRRHTSAESKKPRTREFTAGPAYIHLQYEKAVHTPPQGQRWETYKVTNRKQRGEESK